MTKELTLDVLKNAVAGHAAAFRRVVELQPVGGPGSKVFPPTYEGGKYATERRRISGAVVECVLLDSVQSQANRMEAALQDACDAGAIALPVVIVDFSGTDAAFVGRVTSLQAPHRIADAILRDSLLDGVPFRQSSIGKALDTVSPQNATSLFKHCPTALVFGLWDSTGARGGMGAKFPRAIVSEIVGIGAVPGQRTSSRIDPLQIAVKAGPVYESADGGWTLDSSQARPDTKGNPALVGARGRPSEINHGNVTPSFAVQKVNDKIVTDRDGNPIPIGGFTLDRAQQITTLSLPALRRLRFGQNHSHQATIAAQVTLVALGLSAATLASMQGYDLRSQCALYTDKPLVWELIGAPGAATEEFVLDSDSARALLENAHQEALNAGLAFENDPVILTPRAELVELVLRSVAASEEQDGEGN